MEKLQQAVLEREAAFITELQALLKADCADRIKIARLYQAYVNCISKINTLVSEAQV